MSTDTKTPEHAHVISIDLAPWEAAYLSASAAFTLALSSNNAEGADISSQAIAVAVSTTTKDQRAVFLDKVGNLIRAAIEHQEWAT